jgi:predicted nucleic acid-binding protein
MSVSEAMDTITLWTGRSNTTIIQPLPAYLDDTGRLLTAAGSAGGNLVTDAQIASLAIACRGVVHTSDREFLRFPGLKISFPLDA